MTSFSRNNSSSTGILALHAHPSFVSLDANGKFILIATSQGKKSPGFDFENTIQLRSLSSRFSTGGRQVWKKGLPQPVKSQAISGDGKLSAVTAYDGLLRIFNQKGKLLWTKEHLAKPVFLKSNRLVLLNDDDSDPQFAFFIYDFQGNELFSLKTKSESVETVISSDEQLIATSTLDKKISVFDLKTYKPVWEASFSQKITSFDVIDDELALLSGDELYFFKLINGKITQSWKANLSSRFQSVKISKSNQKIILIYSNLDKKQKIAAFSSTQGQGKIIWEKTYPNPIQYIQPIFLTHNAFSDLLNVPVELMNPAGKIKIAQFYPQKNGSTYKEFLFEAQDGLFSYDVSQKSNHVAVATGKSGDGVIRLFK